MVWLKMLKTVMPALVCVGLFIWLIFVINELVTNWTHAVGLALGLGFIIGCVLYQFAHRSRYGHWFEIKPPE
jgi:L-cystine uptake protein TcyP (sodium:dicarboxylate symporter family)